MGKTSKTAAVPITFDLSQDLIAKIDAFRTRLGMKTASEVVRAAISRFEFGAYTPPAHGHRQISVRLPPPVRAMLLKSSRRKRVSVGELLRVALESYSVRPAGAGAPVKNPTGKTMAKKTAKKPAKKAAGKKGRK